MDVITIAKRMSHKIKELGEIVSTLDELAQFKADAVMNYEKAMALTLVKLRHGDEVLLDDHHTDDIPVSIMDKVARGICSKEKYDVEIAEAGYKSAITKISAIESQLNGLQSINKYLKDMPESH